MKVLTATTRTQGQRPSDFTFCAEGELVTPWVMICDRDQENPDTGCGCGRSFAGLNTHRGTTTAAVRNIDDFTYADLVDAVHAYRAATWGVPADPWPRETSEEEAGEIAEIAAGFSDGAVLETRLGEVTSRETSP
jgi:hypothetical protein